MRLVFDSNIYIAAFLKRGFLFDLLNRALDPKSGLSLFISSFILAELNKKWGILIDRENVSKEEVQNFMNLIQKHTIVVAPKQSVDEIKQDPDDNKILECALSAEANLIVTMDKHLLKLKVFRRMPILHPKTFNYILPRAGT